MTAINLCRLWGGKATLTILDQGIVSGTNFALNIWLARWLASREYGAFAIAFSIFLFLAGFHNALILEPMSVLGPARHGEHLPKYLGNLVWVQLGLSIGLSLVLAVVVLVLVITGSSMTNSFWGLSFATPCILLFWLFRRACYLDSRPVLALKGSVLNALLLLLGLWISQRQFWVSSFSAFLLIALANMGASLFLLCLLGVRIKRLPRAAINSEVRTVLREQWGYGKWIAGSTVMHWLCGAIYIPLIGAYAGLEHAGGFRAMENLLLPLGQVLTALGLLLLPATSAQRLAQGDAFLKKIMFAITSGFLALAGAYMLGILFAGGWLVNLLYGGSQYSAFVWLLPYLGAAAFLGAAGQGVGIALRAAERPDAIFWSLSGGAIVNLTLGFYLARSFGLEGVVTASLLSKLMETVVLAQYGRHSFKVAKNG